MTDKISIVIPFCNDVIQRLPLQINNWKLYPDSFWDRLNIVLVDDCSKRPLINHRSLIRRLPNCDLKIIQVLTDLKWNLPGAFNVGIHVADTEWVFCMDSDHLMTTENMKKVLNIELKPFRFYQFNRNRHSNYEKLRAVKSLASGSWLHTKSQWKELNGLNEDLVGARSGGYGAWDWEYSFRLSERFGRDPIRGIWIEEYLPDVLGESTSTKAKTNHKTLRRNLTKYRVIQNTKKLKLDQEILRFDWKKVYNKKRS